jgi:hypothetical protein
MNAAPMARPKCECCDDKGFVRMGGEVQPCPQCNPDSGYEGNYLRDTRGRCTETRGGGGRICYLHKGHRGPHGFMCGV